MRLFIAIDMPSLVLTQAEQVQQHLKSLHLFKGPYTKSNSMHITLKFLGDVADADVSTIQNALRTVTFPPMHAKLGAVDSFSSGPRIKVIYLHFVCPELAELAQVMDDLLPSYPKEERDFNGHLTLARVKGVGDREKLLHAINVIEVPPVEFTISSFVLKKSEHTPEGPIYTDVEEYMLI